MFIKRKKIKTSRYDLLSITLYIIVWFICMQHVCWTKTIIILDVKQMKEEKKKKDKYL